MIQYTAVVAVTWIITDTKCFWYSHQTRPKRPTLVSRSSVLHYKLVYLTYPVCITWQKYAVFPAMTAVQCSSNLRQSPLPLLIECYIPCTVKKSFSSQLDQTTSHQQCPSCSSDLQWLEIAAQSVPTISSYPSYFRQARKQLVALLTFCCYFADQILYTSVLWHFCCDWKGIWLIKSSVPTTPTSKLFAARPNIK